MENHKRFISIFCVMFVLVAGCSKASKKTVNIDSSVANSGGDKGTDVSHGDGSETVSPVTCEITSASSSKIRSNDSERFTFLCNHRLKMPLTLECVFINNGSSNVSACESATMHQIHGMTNGLKSFYVQATDANGNVGRSRSVHWDSDLTRPGVQITSSNVSSHEVTVRFVGSDEYPTGSTSQLSYTCSIPGVRENFNCASPITQNSLAPSTQYVFKVKSKDRANLESDSVELAFRTQPEAPINGCVITSTFPVHTKSSLQNMTFNCTNPNGLVSAVQCRVNNGNWAACNGGMNAHTVTHPSFDTRIDFEVRYLNEYNNPSPPTRVSWILDFTPPTVSITHKSIQTLQPSFTFSGSDGPGSGIESYQCQLKKESSVLIDWENCQSPHSYLSGLSAGLPYTFAVRAKDRMGHVGSNEFTWISNPGTGPSCVIDTTFAQVWRQNSSETLQFRCHSPVALDSVECKINSGSWSDCSQLSSHRLSGLLSGTQYQFRVRATDVYQNVGEPSSPLIWSVDLNPPTVTLQEVENRNPTAVLRFTPNDTGGSGLTRVECKLETTSGVVHDWTPDCASPRTYQSLVLNRAYTFRVRAFDAAGHQSAESRKIWTSIKQYLGPICRVSPSNLPGWTRQTQQTFQFTCADASSLNRIECSLDGLAWQNCGNSKVVNLTTSGEYNVYARGVDNAGLIGPVDSVTWKADLLPPQVEITGLSFANNQSVITFLATDGGGSGLTKAECRINNSSPWADCTSPAHFSLGTTPGGTFEFQVKASDSAGNTSSTQSYSWTNGAWTNWSTCQASCGQNGLKTRSCTLPTPQNGGLPCVGEEKESCVNSCTAENLGWGPWSECSLACDGGQQSRTCVQPVGQWTGSTCSLNETQTRACNTQSCCIKPGSFHPENGRDAFKDSGMTAAQCRQAGIKAFNLCQDAVNQNPALCCGAGVRSSRGVLNPQKKNDCELVCSCN